MSKNYSIDEIINSLAYSNWDSVLVIGQMMDKEPDTSQFKVVTNSELTFKDVLSGSEDSVTSSAINPNDVIRERKNLLENTKSQFSDQLVSLIREQDFEYGYDSQAGLFVKRLLVENELVIKDWLSSLFVERFSDSRIVLGLLHIISHLDYSMIYPQGLTMATTAMIHKSPEVREGGVRVFENWGTVQSLDFLKTLHCKEEWLQEYIDKVISDLEEELG